MDLKLTFGTSLCYCKEFEINGVEANEDDFGEKYDADPDSAEPYCCGDMCFFPGRITTELLDKYQITLDEANEIQDKLEEGLSFGSCGWCS